MVCSLGRGRMEAMARLLTAGRFSQIIAEEVGNPKLVAQYIQRDLHGADEANLLDEEDMHVFDLKPMTDPLYLVRCNACKKPIKASQYAAHAELCNSLSSAEEVVSELESGTGSKKPPRKERRKLLPASTTGGEQERFESAEADDVATSDEQVQLTSSFSMEAKRNSSSVNGALIMDVSRASPQSIDYSRGAMPPPTKRSKLIAAEGLPMSDHLEPTSGVAKSLCTSSQEARIHIPAPLATKTFYSQRNHRLRSELMYLYHEASSKEHFGDFVNSKALQGNATPLQVSYAKSNYHERVKAQREKRKKHSLPSVEKTDPILTDGSDLFLDNLGGCTPAMASSNPIPVNHDLRTQKAPVGIMRSNFLSKPYSGTTLGTMQQPKGSVPVT